jgi:hypothetical protein
LQPYAGAYDELQNHHFGMEAALAQPVTQGLGEAPAGPRLPAAGALLHLPGARAGEAVLTLHVKQAEAGGDIIARVYNPTNEAQEVLVGSGLLQLREVAECDLFEQPQQPLIVEDGQARASLPARQWMVLRLNASLDGALSADD